MKLFSNILLYIQYTAQHSFIIKVFKVNLEDLQKDIDEEWLITFRFKLTLNLFNMLSLTRLLEVSHFLHSFYLMVCNYYKIHEIIAVLVFYIFTVALKSLRPPT